MSVMKRLLNIGKSKKTVIVALVGFVVFILWWTEPTLVQFGTVKVWDRNNILLYESAGNIGRKIPITYDELPQHLIDATVAAEDITFWTNPGIDLKAIIRSAYLNVKRKKIVSGASTITQQLTY